MTGRNELFMRARFRTFSVCFAVASLGIAMAGQAALPPSPAEYGVRLEKTTIPMHDGVRLAVTLYMPDGGAKNSRFPVLLEYLPYRKDDDEAARDYANHSYFARHGYVAARVDIRGFGNSQGTPPEREYSAQEQSDGEEIIAWLARQSWSNGNVGMLGISWGGFNSIQMAMRHPQALKAILATAATEELFKEDVHYMDGIFHVDEFELTMDLDQGRSGAPDYTLDPKIIGPRMDSEPWSLMYVKHQRDGAFWRSPVRPLETLQVPCFLIGGLQDGYRDSIPRMLERVRGAPVKAWIGPWNHGFPNEADYGPLVEWRDQAVRWFDYWLKGRDTGIMAEPRVVYYVQHWHPPTSQPQDIPGEWRADAWPPRGRQELTFYLQPEHRLAAEPTAAGTDHLRYVPSVGVEAGFWWGELVTDQRPVDAYSYVYDSPPLETDIAIFGRPRALLQAGADVPLSNWFVRLSDVAPDGQVTLITGAGLNGAQRNSMAEPIDMKPGELYPLNIELHLGSWVFPKGHRIRLAVSNALWPMTWPTPAPMTTMIALGGSTPSRMLLPAIPLHGPAPPAFAQPESVEVLPGITHGESSWPGSFTFERDEAAGRSTVVWSGKTATAYPWGQFNHTEKLTYRVDDNHPEAASIVGESEYFQAIPEHVLHWHGLLTVTSDAQTYYYKYTRTMERDGQPVRSKSWEAAVPRDHQ
jgi:uncharacterized protein